MVNLQDLVFDAETKSALHTEMAKKNLFVKRGGIPSAIVHLFSCCRVSSCIILEKFGLDRLVYPCRASSWFESLLGETFDVGRLRWLKKVRWL